jgi:hypothetical protein
MSVVRNISETIARKTSRRGFFEDSLRGAFGVLAGVAAGTADGSTKTLAGSPPDTVCFFPRNEPCPCENCLENGTCAKPCVIYTIAYASGCWVTDGVTCCDCTCPDAPATGDCGCGTDWHNDATNCPNGNAG